MSEKVVFVTGASGFIGGWVVREFAARGFPVMALVHRQESKLLSELAAAGKVSVIRGDAADPGLVEQVRADGRRLGHVVNVAGLASDSGSRAAFGHANLDAVCNLARLTLALDAERLVQISTTDVYGLRDFHGETETELPFNNNRRNFYPEFKIKAEEWLRGNLPSSRFAILRPAAVWGPNDTTLTLRFAEFLRTSPWIIHFGKWRGRNRWPLAHVRNVAMAAAEACLQSEVGGQAINVLDREITTIDEFYQLVTEIYHPGRRYRRCHLPLWLGTTWGMTSNAITKLLSRRVIDPSYYAVHSLSWNLDFSNARFEDLLMRGGRRPVTKEEAVTELRDTCLPSSRPRYFPEEGPANA